MIGKFNAKVEFKPVIIEKSPEVKQQIEERLKGSFMFSILPPTELAVVIDAMKEVVVAAGETIIKEGDK